MIKCDVNRDRADRPVEIKLEGDALQIADDVANVIRAIYEAMKDADVLGAEMFRHEMVCVVAHRTELWGGRRDESGAEKA